MTTLIHTLKYKEPHLRDYKGDVTKRWAVYWYIFDTKNERWIRQVKWISINLNPRERYTEAERLISEIKKDLKRGFTGDAKKNIPRIEEAIDMAIAFKSNYLSSRTSQSYTNIAAKFKKWAKKNCPVMKVTDFTKYDANRFLNELFIKKKFAAKTINCYTQYLQAIFNYIGELHKLDENPFKKKKLKEAVPEITVWDDGSKKKLADYTRVNEPELFIIILLVYHCFIRPNEIRLLKIKDIDLDKGIVRINASTSKTNIFKSPTLSNQLIELLQPIASSYNKNLYLFSDELRPGPKPISRNIISMRFKHIREKLGISKELKLYSFKHTGNSELIDLGINIRELQLQNGHTSIAMTERYIYRLNSGANLNIKMNVKNL
ncbi:MAG: site-specific integrase [Bacteroidales bacterium]|nr:site-specific integrase [Bacteroidales bacterium]